MLDAPLPRCRAPASPPSLRSPRRRERGWGRGTFGILIVTLLAVPALPKPAQASDFLACTQMLATGFRPIAESREQRFLGQVADYTARCRGGDQAAQFRTGPYVDWPEYWAAGDAASLASDSRFLPKAFSANRRGVDGAILDLEYQRLELIKFNLFDNSGTYPDYVRSDGPVRKVWDSMRLPKTHRDHNAVGGDGEQLCRGESIRFRTLDGICNDIRNPLMGSTNQLFARNVEFDATFPDLGKNEYARNRHGDRLALLKPDPQVISRKLFTRAQSQPDKCRGGHGLPGYSPEAQCDYKKAPFFNVLAAFWIQFMTHDWFSHLREGHNQAELMPVGCARQLVDNVERSLTPSDVARLE